MFTYSFIESVKLLPDFIMEQFVLLSSEQFQLCLGLTFLTVGVFIGVSGLVEFVKYYFR